MSRSENKKAMARYVSENPSCELCGSRKMVECHHVLPLCMENYGVNFDVEDNYISVCAKCHALLTPRSLLSKYGVEKARWKKNALAGMVSEFYTKLHDAIDVYQSADVEMVLDVFDSVFNTNNLLPEI